MDDVRIRLSEKASVQFIRRKVDSVAENVISLDELFQVVEPVRRSSELQRTTQTAGVH